MRERTFSVYIVASPSRVIYVGITNDLERRIAEHREKAIAGFTARYNITRLVYFEQYDRATEAIAREKQLKGWTRAKKVALIERNNPIWNDLSGERERGSSRSHAGGGNRASLHERPGSFDSSRSGLRSG